MIYMYFQFRKNAIKLPQSKDAFYLKVIFKIFITLFEMPPERKE